MKNKSLFWLPVSFLIVLFSFQQETMPSEFDNAKNHIPDLDVELRYFSEHNFVGDTINGYYANKLLLTRSTIDALKKVQDELQKQNLCLRVYDGYRPQEAVNHFIQWARDTDDTLMKQEFYPKIDKRSLFKEGYIASKSGHSRGSTVDLTIIDGTTAEPLDMGSPYDFFGPISWVAHSPLNTTQKNNRMLLQKVMVENGFRNYDKEWWHFTLRNETFPKRYFNFPVK